MQQQLIRWPSDVPIEVGQGMLDQAWYAAPNSANTLREQFVSFEQAALSLMSGGSLASVAKNAASQSYAMGNDALSQMKLQRCWRALINLFDFCRWEIDQELAENPADTQSPGNDQDPAIYARMQLMLQSVTEYNTDLTDLLLPPVIAPPVPMTQ